MKLKPIIERRDKVTFGEKIKLLRKQNNITQTQLAELTGVSLRTIINYEKYDKKPKQPEMYELLAKALNTEVSELQNTKGDYVSITKKKLTKTQQTPVDFLSAEINRIFASDKVSDEDKLTLLLNVEKSFWKHNLKRKTNKKAQ